MRRVKYGRERRQIERCHKHEQMAENGAGQSERGREGARERQADREREREEREGEKSGSG